MNSSSSCDFTERDALIALSLAEGVGLVTMARNREERISFVDALNQLPPSMNADVLLERRLSVEKDAAAAGAHLLTFIDAEYPAALLDLPVPPPLLFTRGSREMLSGPVVAIVGTRAVTRYGERISRELGSALAAAGVCVVSGLARGVDSAAHCGALDASGNTCAVIGTGIDLTYPAAHATLQRTIGERGLLVSESLPGARPTPGSFPMRNRIIAALAQVTIVVEAGRKSGALITADRATELGRTVAAVPGPIDSMQSVGTNHLMRDGAQVIASIDDALALLGVSPARVPAADRELSQNETAILGALIDRELTSQQIVEVSALPVSDCLAAISSLELSGHIVANLTGEFRRLASPARRAVAAL